MITIFDEDAGAFVLLNVSDGTAIKLDQEKLEMVEKVARKMLKDFSADRARNVSATFMSDI